MGIYAAARKINSLRKRAAFELAGRELYPVRRISRVLLPRGERVCAMTFDDGPCGAFVTPDGGTGLTEYLLSVLAEYSARVTFDIIGSTAGNYPDTEGTDGKFSWSGKKYDHYPLFGEDGLAGAENRPELVARMLAAGHELSNHTYSHRLFGPMRAVYGGRDFQSGIKEAADDTARLHLLVIEKFGYKMKLCRPPHYIDRARGGDAYDIMRYLGYNYLGASFDGAGWQPCNSEGDEVSAMTEPLRRALKADPDALCGQIIFEKDGCNMAKRVPVARALPEKLRILSEYEYKVIPVSEMTALSPFSDTDHDILPFLLPMLDAGHTVGYKNNTFHGERQLNGEMLAAMLCPPVYFSQSVHMPPAAVAKAGEVFLRTRGIDCSFEKGASYTLLSAADALGVDISGVCPAGKMNMTRREALPAISLLSAAADRLCTPGNAGAEKTKEEELPV